MKEEKQENRIELFIIGTNAAWPLSQQLQNCTWKFVRRLLVGFTFFKQWRVKLNAGKAVIHAGKAISHVA